MKNKSLVLLAITGVLASSVLFSIPAVADEAIDNADEPLQVLADNGMQNDMNTNQDNTATANNPSVVGSSNPVDTNTNSPSGNDAGSPDTATGDDDY